MLLAANNENNNIEKFETVLMEESDKLQDKEF
jgi:hypothetical protein